MEGVCGLFPLVSEWVLTNGVSPEFPKRVQATLKSWKIVGGEGLTVYRGQGHSIPGIPILGEPTSLVPGLRPVLATTMDMKSAEGFSGKDCCIYEIHLSPGARYLDIADTIKTVGTAEEETLQTMKEMRDRYHEETKELREKYKKDPSVGKCPPIPTNSRNKLLETLKKRSFAEKEIIVYNEPGWVFSPPVENGEYNGIKKFAVMYGPLPGGRRGRTFRRKAKRMNKNGHRPTRKSKRWRYGQLGNC